MTIMSFIGKNQRARRQTKRRNMYWGVPEQRFAFGSAWADGFIGALMALALVIGIIGH